MQNITASTTPFSTDRAGNIRTRHDNGSVSRYQPRYNVFLRRFAPGAFTRDVYTQTNARARARARSPPALIRHRNYRSDLSRSIPSAGDSNLNVSLRTFDLTRFFIAPALPARAVGQPRLPFFLPFLPMLLL